MGVHELGGQLKAVLQQLDQAKEVSKITLGHEALAIIKDLLEVDPYDIDALVWRMKLNAGWAFDESAKIIEDAEFIASNDSFGESKMIGYDWLTWVYEEKLGMPNKAIEVIENQLVEVYSVFKKRYVKDQYEGELLNKMAFIKFHNDEKEEALALWKKSFDKYPYNHERNAVAGMMLLELKRFEEAAEMLLLHFVWSAETEDEYLAPYTKKLQVLAEKNELDAHPDLIGLYYHGIRNAREEFGLYEKLDFFEHHLPKLEQIANQHPNNSILWAAVGNTYFLDIKNFELAFRAYKKMLEGDKPTMFEVLKRIHRSAKKVDADFFSLPFTFEGLSSSLYNHMSQMSTFAKKTNKQKKQKKYLKLSIKYGEQCHQQYLNYLKKGEGRTLNNQPHLFAMSCNNFGLALNQWNELVNEDDPDLELAERIGNIHSIGYKMSPFSNNLYNGATAFYEAQNYGECIAEMEEYMISYKSDLSFYDIQDLLWYILFSYAGMENYSKVEHTYFRAKKIYEKAGKGVSDAAMKFIYIAKKYFQVNMFDQERYEEIIPEMEWFLAQRSFDKIAIKEVGLLNYYLGLSYQKVNRMEDSVIPLQKCVDLLQEEDLGYYYDKSEEAAQLLNEMGKKSGHQYEADKPKGTGFFSRFKKKLSL